MSFFQVTPRELRNKAGKISELNSRFKAKQQELTLQYLRSKKIPVQIVI